MLFWQNIFFGFLPLGKKVLAKKNSVTSRHLQKVQLTKCSALRELEKHPLEDESRGQLTTSDPASCSQSYSHKPGSFSLL